MQGSMALETQATVKYFSVLGRVLVMGGKGKAKTGKGKGDWPPMPRMTRAQAEIHVEAATADLLNVLDQFTRRELAR